MAAMEAALLLAAPSLEFALLMAPAQQQMDFLTHTLLNQRMICSSGPLVFLRIAILPVFLCLCLV